MRLLHLTLLAFTTTAIACAQRPRPLPALARPPNYIGFDANDYPGDARLPALRKQFAFTGYWLTNPPGTNSNSWVGKRDILLRNGFGFLVLANGRFDKEILRAQKAGKPPPRSPARMPPPPLPPLSVKAFPLAPSSSSTRKKAAGCCLNRPNTCLPGPRLSPAPTTAPGFTPAASPCPTAKVPTASPSPSPPFRTFVSTLPPGISTPSPSGHGRTPARLLPGCVVHPANPPAPALSGTIDLSAWQYAKSPRSSSITQACRATYNRDGNCYAPGVPSYWLDLDASASPDPSHGR